MAVQRGRARLDRGHARTALRSSRSGTTSVVIVKSELRDWRS